MDKDLARAMVLERCACYDRALDSAKKVLEKYDVDSDEAFWARRIIKALAEQFLKQRFADKAMECYRLTIAYTPDESTCVEEEDVAPFDALGPLSVKVTTNVSADVHDMLKKVRNISENLNKTEEELIREGIYLLILKYASDQTVRDVIFTKLEKTISDAE